MVNRELRMNWKAGVVRPEGIPVGKDSFGENSHGESSSGLTHSLSRVPILHSRLKRLRP